MESNTRKEDLCSLMAHLSALIDTPDILATVAEETKRYTLMALGDEARLSVDHTVDRWHPCKRPTITWKQIDHRYLKIDMRRDILSKLLNTLEYEEKFFSERGEHLDCIPRIHHMLYDVVEQLEGMGNAPLGAIPEKSITVESFPPIQRLEHEGKVLRDLALECLDDDLTTLYAEQHAFLAELLDGWVRELLPIETSVFLGTYDLYVGCDFIAVRPH